uniref:Cilia and flagella associated protein 61 n=1 Tax=Sphaeramia orbicularis TaxID=375764 RepID=A0A673B1J1_9TELE
MLIKVHQKCILVQTLIEKANLAVTLANEKDDIVAHASFFDHPYGGLVDQAQWEPFLQEHFSAEKCTPMNTLFLHLFVAQPGFTTASIKEIMKYENLGNFAIRLPVLSLSPYTDSTDAGLSGFYRVEDHDDIMRLFTKQPKLPSVFKQPYFLVQLIEDQTENNHTAVCQVSGLYAVWSDMNVCLVWCIFCRQEEKQSTEAAQLPSNQNAFCIQFFTFDKKYEMSSVSIQFWICSFFHLFSPDIHLCVPQDREFCIITVPHLFREFPLLQNFIRVPPRTHFSSFPQELYVFHRHGLRSVEVRRAVASDRPAVSDLVKDLRLNQSLLQDLDRSQVSISTHDNRSVVSSVFLSPENLIVNCAHLPQDVEYICARYNIENYIYFSEHCYEEHARLLHFVLNALFQHFTKHVFKEVLRLAHISCLYHRTYPPELSQENSCVPNLDLFLNCAVPVHPRRQIIYPLEELGTNAPSRRITEDQPPFSLSLISRKLTMEPKVTVNVRIVVVGASDTGLSFLEVLSCFYFFYFYFFYHGYSSRDLALVPLRSHISVITGKMVGLCRKSKRILVSNGKRVPYDFLVLCTGLQYQVPSPTGDVGQSVPNLQLQAQWTHRTYTGPIPSNLFTLNDLHDCRIICWRMALFSCSVLKGHNAVVYGSSVDVYTTVEALLSLGVRGSRIHLVLLPSKPGVSCFSDPSVDKAVTAALKTAEVHVHRNCLLAQMNDGEHPDPLRMVSFTTDAELLRLQCGVSVFINLSTKGVDHDAFRSITKSHLVFDYRLVINSSFHTYDEAILGAGPLTKFSRRYYSDEWTHANFNSREVGQALAVEMLPMFDPTLKPADETADTDRLIPIYKDAKIQGGRLPGGLNYLHVTKPSPNISDPPDSVMKTGRAEMGNYFCLRLNPYHQVETLTCLSLKPLPVSNYLCLYRKHKLLLSQLSTHYNDGLIPDLYR